MQDRMRCILPRFGENFLARTIVSSPSVTYYRSCIRRVVRHTKKNTVVNVIVVTPVRLLAESLVACLAGHAGIQRLETACDIAAAEDQLRKGNAQIVLIDISANVDNERMRALAAQWPEVRFLALGLEEQCDSVVRCGRMGFAGYVPRNAGLETLRKAVIDCRNGRFHCSGEATAHLMRALFAKDSEPASTSNTQSLTSREDDVTRLIRRGYSNKEIARELNLSVATVKHHVHNILAKFQVTRRAHVMRLSRRG
jgi:DNA-binding NarL/FixJ family response regulator